jgi:hypothetical protein
MKRIVVGDLHGDLELYRKIKATFPDYMITLVGALVDSYVFSRKGQLALMNEVLNDIEAGITESIIGNHEWSYLWPERMQCSGYSPAFAAQLMPLHSRMLKPMKPFIFDRSYSDPILITHAGLSAKAIDNLPKDIEMFLNDAIRSEDGMAFDIGHSRGGTAKVGGIFWCDFNQDFEPIPGLRQIFGHTRVDGVQTLPGGNYAIDCMEQKHPQVLKIGENGIIEAIDILCLQQISTIITA